MEGKLCKRLAKLYDCSGGMQYLEAIKWPSHNTSIFREVYLFSDTVVCAFSEGGLGEILASIQCPKTVVCAFSEGGLGEILASIQCPKTSLIHNIFL